MRLPVTAMVDNHSTSMAKNYSNNNPFLYCVVSLSNGLCIWNEYFHVESLTESSTCKKWAKILKNTIIENWLCRTDVLSILFSCFFFHEIVFLCLVASQNLLSWLSYKPCLTGDNSKYLASNPKFIVFWGKNINIILSVE